MRLAAVDLGTNSVKLLVAEAGPRGIKPLEERVVITRLGEGVGRTKRMPGEAMDRTLEVLAQFRETAHRLGAKRIAAVGTRVFRAAANAGDFLLRAEFEAGLPIRILSGEEEARLSYLGATSGVESACAIDIGGGSTEFMIGEKRRLREAWSADIGAVSITEECLRGDPPAAAELDRAWARVRKELRRLPATGTPLLGIGGTTATAAAIRQHRLPRPSRIHGQTLRAVEIDEQLRRLSAMPHAQRLKVRGLERGRADIIVGGLLILSAVMQLGSFPEVRVSAFGIRHGVALELASGRWGR